LTLRISVSHAQGSPKAVLSIKPGTHVYSGERVIFRCDIRGGGDTAWTYSWYKNNETLDHYIFQKYYRNYKYYRYHRFDRYFRDYRDRTMWEFIIWPVDEPDVGNYTCRGQKHGSEKSEISDAVTLTVSVLTSLTPVSHAQGSPKAVLSIKPGTHVYSGERVIFRCDIHGGGDTAWTYSWYKNNETLDLDMFHEHYKFHRFDRFFRDYRDHTVREFIIWPVDESDSGNYTCRGERRGSQSSEISDAVTLIVSRRPKVVLRVSPQSWLTEGDSVTLSCEVTDSSTGWTFSWYTEYREIKDSHGEIVSGDSYHISITTFDHTGVYMCRAEKEESSLRLLSNHQPVWINGESPPVSLIINPNRTQHFTGDSLLLSCEGQSNSTGWTVRQHTYSGGVSSWSWWRSITGSTCNISSLSTYHTGVYWCESDYGENRNPVNITVHGGDVILESPVHPVSEEHPLTLRCLFRNTNTSNLRVDFYKNGSVFQNQTDGEMIIYNVSKSDEGFYHCKHPERGASPKSWVSVRGVETTFSALMLISSVVTASPYLLVTIILLIKCCRAR
ncbi:Fc receptor-like protein 5 isoform X1, partial [Clarias magur]